MLRPVGKVIKALERRMLPGLKLLAERHGGEYWSVALADTGHTLGVEVERGDDRLTLEVVLSKLDSRPAINEAEVNWRRHGARFWPRLQGTLTRHQWARLKRAIPCLFAFFDRNARRPDHLEGGIPTRVIGGFGGNQRPALKPKVQAPEDDPEYVVYRTALEALFPDETIVLGGRTQPVESFPEQELEQEHEALGIPELSLGMFRQMMAKPVWLLQTRDALPYATDENWGGQHFWRGFHRRHPGAKRLVDLSRVGFDGVSAGLVVREFRWDGFDARVLLLEQTTSGWQVASILDPPEIPQPSPAPTLEEDLSGDDGLELLEHHADRVELRCRCGQGWFPLTVVEWGRLWQARGLAWSKPVVLVGELDAPHIRAAVAAHLETEGPWTGGW